MPNIKTYIEKTLSEINQEVFKWIFINNEKTDYKIGSKGTVISFKERTNMSKGQTETHTLKCNIMDSGYCVVCLYHGNMKYWKYVHRLVAEAFIPIPDKYISQGLTIDNLEVNHIDGTFLGKSKNTVDNLEWATSSDNKFHAYKHRLKLSGEGCPASIYKDSQIKRVCELLEENKLGNRSIWKETGVSVTTIQAILSGNQWKDISKNYDFTNHKKQHNIYSEDEIKDAIELLSTSSLSFKDIGDIIGMTRNSVWFVNKKYGIRK